MKRGPKPVDPSTKKARGTYQKSRDSASALIEAMASNVQIIPPDAIPQRPDWLTEHGRYVWDEELQRVLQNGTVTELDTMAFANYCNLQGSIIEAYKAGEVAPAAFMMEVRKMQEQFGLLGSRSRVRPMGKGAPPPAGGASGGGSRFSRNGFGRS